MAIFRNPFGFDSGSYSNRASGGLAALLQQAIEQQRLRQQGDISSLLDATPDRLPAGAGNSPGLFARLLASQSHPGPSISENREPTSPASPDPNFRQLSRLSPPQARSANNLPVDSNSDAEAQASAKSESGSSFQVAQALVPPIFGMPYSIFVRPPALFQRALPRIEDWPTGSSNGPGIGKPFSRSMGPKEGEEMPDCIYCLQRTTREPGPLRHNNEHKIPRSRGGDNSEDNHGDACQTCNFEKGPKTPEEYYDYLKRNGAPVREDNV
jgi:HNH endonuclease